MTPPAAMVTEAEAAEWRKRYTEPGSAAIYSAPIVLALLADRERTLGLLRGLLPAVDCPWDEDGTCTEANCMKEQARVALMQAGRIPWPECSGCAVALAPGCAHAEGCEEAGRDAR